MSTKHDHAKPIDSGPANRRWGWGAFLAAFLLSVAAMWYGATLFFNLTKLTPSGIPYHPLLEDAQTVEKEGQSKFPWIRNTRVQRW